ncbi:hypothetical protein NDU88_006536 [Pleurodeles waltl]|uniref:Uncharacterized protein n=1 Tax=Pleurodeles waltl TaxID=8319 RepID=A0AAV7VPX8_PLEWA|nr:hypothetical protein NDU88_006536 [Pleurodeles waltl]
MADRRSPCGWGRLLGEPRSRSSRETCAEIKRPGREPGAAASSYIRSWSHRGQLSSSGAEGALLGIKFLPTPPHPTPTRRSALNLAAGALHTVGAERWCDWSPGPATPWELGPAFCSGHDAALPGGATRTDFSKETSDRRRAFLSLCPRLRQLEVKYGLFDVARMWITKNGASKDFYDPEDLRSLLDGLSLTDCSTLTPHQDTTAAYQNTPSHDLAPGGSGSAHQLALPCPRGRDLERLLHSHDDRGQVLHAVALHTQMADRNKSRSPLKPLAEPT